MESLILELGDLVKQGLKTWQEATDEYNSKKGETVSKEAFRKRYVRLKKTAPQKEAYTLKGGLIEEERNIWFDKDEKKSPDLVLKKFGYDPEEVELISLRIGYHEVAIAEEKSNRVCYNCKIQIKPIIKKEIELKQAVETAKEIFKEINPLPPSEKTLKGLDKEKLIELPAIELHLGKMSHFMDTGENYDYKIAQDRFKEIIDRVYLKQQVEKAGTLFVSIGSDFFNTDTTQNTTTKGTPQQNDLRYKKMFLVGLKMYTEALYLLRDQFEKIDIQLNQGNHDTMSSFYLYIALSQLFKGDEKIKFSENYQATQCYIFGKCAIFTNHGDPNLKRLQKSIPAEFFEEWGKTIHRELHIGHLHIELTVDENSGLVTRRIPSPSGTDEWHYNSRYVGNIPRHQIFIWDKEKGLVSTEYIAFDKKKGKIK